MVSDGNAIVVEDGYVTNHRFVTLRSDREIAEMVGSAAVEAARSTNADRATFDALSNLAATASGFGASRAGGDVDTLIAPSETMRMLLALERTDLLVAATPLRRPRQDGDDAAALLPRGSGQVFAASLEAFRTDDDVSTDVLAGTMHLEFADADAARAAHAEMAQDSSSIASIERVPARWLQATLPAETREPIVPWHLARIRADRARGLSGYEDAREVEVAVLDTGVDLAHPFLEPVIATYSYDPPRRGVRSDSRDLSSHGTHVAGTISAQGPASNVEGVSRSKLHIYKIFDDHVDRVVVENAPDGQRYLRNVHYVNPVMYARALQDCVDSNFPVINLSIGGTAEGSSEEKRLYRHLVEQGQIVVAAMGNMRQEGSPTSWPARYDGVVSVGALDFNDQVARFSNQGDHISICAPGVEIFATMPTYRGVERYLAKADGSGNWVRGKELHWTVYRATKSGTSMAAPQVAAAAALWVARHGRGREEFVSQLQQSARKLSRMGSSSFTPDYGHGCLDVERLLS